MVAILIVFFEKNQIKWKNPPKKAILWHGVLLYVLVSMKNDKLDFWRIIQKKSSQKGLSCINIYKFQAKWPSYHHFHDIVCDKGLIFEK